MLASCKFSGQYTDLSGPKPLDYEKSYLEIGPDSFADGTSPVLVAIYLINSDDRKISDVVPELSISGAVVKNCSSSDSSGRSNCTLVSSVAGEYDFVVRLPADKILSGIAKFKPIVLNKQARSLSSGGDQSQQGAGGFIVKGTVGASTNQSVLQGTGGWKVYMGIQGAIEEN